MKLKLQNGETCYASTFEDIGNPKIVSVELTYSDIQALMGASDKTLIKWITKLALRSVDRVRNLSNT